VYWAALVVAAAGGRAHQRAYGLLCRYQRGCGEGAPGTRTHRPLLGERARGAEGVGRRNAGESTRVSLLARAVRCEGLHQHLGFRV